MQGGGKGIWSGTNRRIAWWRKGKSESPFKENAGGENSKLVTGGFARPNPADEEESCQEDVPLTNKKKLPQEKRTNYYKKNSGPVTKYRHVKYGKRGEKEGEEVSGR